MKRRGLLAASLSLVALMQAAGAAPLVPVLARPAEQTALAEGAVLIAATRAGDRLVAVGERGIVLLSDDSGRTWRQARVPVSVSLTAVVFPTPRRGWAAGHAGVILHSEDGGETWVLQMDGKHAQELLLAEAGQGDAKLAAIVRSLAAPAPDKPFLGLYFDDEQTGYALGAYGLLFRTTDGGKVWQSWFTHTDNHKGMHLYAMAGDGKNLFLAGEQGLLLRAEKEGERFTVADAPYRGSYFALANIAGDKDPGQWLLAGLKGTLLRSRDGRSFEPVVGLPPISWSSLSRAGNRLLLVNQAGMGFSLDTVTCKITPIAAPPGFLLNALVAAPDGSLVGIGLRGVIRIAAAAQ